MLEFETSNMSASEIESGYEFICHWKVLLSFSFVDKALLYELEKCKSTIFETLSEFINTKIYDDSVILHDLNTDREYALKTLTHLLKASHSPIVNGFNINIEILNKLKHLFEHNDNVSTSEFIAIVKCLCYANEEDVLLKDFQKYKEDEIEKLLIITKSVLKIHPKKILEHMTLISSTTKKVLANFQFEDRLKVYFFQIQI